MSSRSNDLQRHYHLAGIGGAGMSGLARFLLEQGSQVTGSDVADSTTVEALRCAGAEVTLAQDGSSMPDEAQVYVASLAVEDRNAELAEAERRGLEVLRYPEAVGRLMAASRGFCVAGTHGKTTITAALAFCLERCGTSPSFIVGGEVPQLGASARRGQGDWFVVEACEYQRAFLAYQPQAAIISNVEAEHLDYYRDEADVIDAFGSFAANVRPDGFLLVCAESPKALQAAERATCSVETYALEAPADWVATLVETSPGTGLQRFHLQHGDRDMGDFETVLPGAHNVLNSAAVIAATRRMGLNLTEVRKVVVDFRGAARRFEVVGESAGVTVVDDFAHHPTELRALLDAARNRYPGRRLICVFQPHQYSRTQAFLREFAEALSLADLVIVAPIYEARDTQRARGAVSAKDVAVRVTSRGGCVEAAPSFTYVENRLAEVLRDGDVLLTVGAGDVWKIGKRVVRRLEKRRAV